MKIKLIKKSDRYFIELPKEFGIYDELELFKLKEGFYLMTIPLESQVQKEEKKKENEEYKVSEEEKALIQKLLKIRFEERTPAYVSRILNQKEKEILRELENKRFVNVYKGEKYKQGVYNINDRVYSVIYTQQNKPKNKEDDLFKNGYLVASEKEALALLEKIKEQIKKGEIRGMKGFDGNYYIITLKLYNELSRKILKTLDKEKEISEIAKTVKVEEEAVRAVLHFLAEAGEVIEKRKNVYVAV
ncbi:MAG: hypothetical protein QXF35_00335 [Candidatus Bilamarchaeaceae archaeon]